MLSCSTPIKLSFRRSLSVINVLSLSSAYVQLRPNPRPDATVREKKQARDSPRQTRPDRSRPASVRLSSSLIFGGPVQTYKTKLSFRRSLSVINVLSLSSAYVQLRPNPRPDATVREKKQARDSSRQRDPIGAVPRPFVSARL
ncbi:hypothetical protein DY000_02004186 [Brassica cretica]|uniref:Uncharacterized protein n=1 Tax=Brassica cretica TaxID=69181 RepID=A0ABQ7C2Y4_BRACR|nr:hypothetical protein DY000_02004186 [Brassica cretica]